VQIARVRLPVNGARTEAGRQRRLIYRHHKYSLSAFLAPGFGRARGSGHHQPPAGFDRDFGSPFSVRHWLLAGLLEFRSDCSRRGFEGKIPNCCGTRPKI
jgi:hypothetical protein